MYSTKIDDIFSMNRQMEIQSVVQSLVQFSPTKIALELPQDKNNEIKQEYQAFLADKSSLTASEYHQLGFQLAREINHQEVFAVDWNGTIKGVPDIEAWVKEHNSADFDEMGNKAKELTVNAEKFYRNHSVREFLLYLNDSENIRKNHELYMKLALVGSNSEPVGAMWTAQYWYYRNMLIYRNIVDLINSEDERILVFYGSGHLHILNQFFKESGLFRVETASDYL